MTVQDTWAFYYPWYRGHRNWLERVPGTPVLGEYDSKNPEVVKQHFEWSINSGIDAWAVNWDRSSYRETWIDDLFLPSEYSDRFGFFLQPATLGRFTWDEGHIDFDREVNRQALQKDFQYFSDRYFSTNPYVRIEERPVLFWFAAGSFRGDVRGAFIEAEAKIEEDIYHIIDIPGHQLMDLHTERFSHFDGISPYNPYNPEWVEKFDFRGFLDRVLEEYQRYSLVADNAGIDFYPTVIPGYNETQIDDRNRDFPPLEPTPHRFKQLCEEAPRTMDLEKLGVFVTSFNEWPEFTAVEPSQQHGEAFLEIIKNTLVGDEFDPLHGEYVPLELRFNKSVNLTGARPLSLMLGELILKGEDGVVRHYNIGVPKEEPRFFVEGAYPPEKNSNHDPSSWRWLGGPTERAVTYLDPPQEPITEVVLVGKPSVDNQIRAEVVINEDKAGSVEFGERGAVAKRYSVRID